MVHCIESHYGEVGSQHTVDAVLAQIADGSSGGRRGASRVDRAYVKRLERLEDLHRSLRSREDFAMQAGDVRFA